MRILLVEDDPVFAELLRAQLRRMPWVESRLEVAGTLADAVARVAGGSFDLVIADLNLPDSHGLATVDALSRAGAQLIIVLTGDPSPQLRAAWLESGGSDYHGGKKNDNHTFGFFTVPMHVVETMRSRLFS